MSWSKAVASAMVSEIGYDDETQEMQVTWAKGGQGTYLGVPEDVADACARAPSVGQYIITEIKPAYQYRRG